MPTHLNLRYKEIEDLWPYIEKYQSLATAYNIPDIFQDAGGKMLQLAIATGFDIAPGKTGADATDRIGNIYEVKTTDLDKKTSGFSTNHHLTCDTIKRYRGRNWIFAYYKGINLNSAFLVEAKYLETYFRQWTATLKIKSHINNPKIPLDIPHT